MDNTNPNKNLGIPLEHFRTIDYVHVREGRLVYLQKFTGAG
jgi:hypothetical protein